MGCEELYIKRIEAGIRAIKLGTKSPKEASLGRMLNNLKDLNEGQYEDLMNNYKAVLIDYKKNNPEDLDISNN